MLFDVTANRQPGATLAGRMTESQLARFIEEHL
jgi:hypothetical protein